MKGLVEKQGVLWTDSKTLLIYIDVETGGFSVEKNALLSISICLPKVNRRLQPDDWFMFPEKPRWVHSQAKDVNGFSWDSWRERGAVSLEAALDRFVDRVEIIRKSYRARKVAFCAHNANFDRRFLLYNLKDVGWDADEDTWDWFCSKRTCQSNSWMIGGLSSFGLIPCCEAFRLKTRQGPFHEAREDVVLGSKLVLSLTRRGISLAAI